MHDYEVLGSERVYSGGVISLRRDEVSMPGETSAHRDVVEHPGAVGVIALDDQDRVLLVRQYRHPVGRHLDEIPAGLLDVTGEPAVEAARRELGEEAGLGARTWHVLVDALTSPGMTDETIRIYLARDVHPVERDVQEHEEAEMTTEWVPLETAVQRVLSGEIENAMCALGVLAAAEARRLGFAGLRGSDAPWRARKPAG